MVEDAQHRHGALQIKAITVRTPVARDDEQHLLPDPVGAGTGNHPARERGNRVGESTPPWCARHVSRVMLAGSSMVTS